MDDFGEGSEDKKTLRPLVRQITEDGRKKLEIYRPTTNPVYIYTQVLESEGLPLFFQIFLYATKQNRGSRHQCCACFYQICHKSNQIFFKPTKIN